MAQDWTHIHSFAAVAREGSLSAAARKLGLSQPTLGRHIHAMEQASGAPLFTRTARGLEPTDLALDLLAEAARMEEAANRLALIAEGRSESLSGTVRITASVVVSHFILPPVLARIRQAEPLIQLELVPSDATENLLFREADIAIRMYRPEQSDVITRHVCDSPIGIYAASSFLDRMGRPATLEDALKLDFVGFDRSDLIIRFMRDMGLQVDRNDFPLRCDDQAAFWHLVRAGCGIGAAQCVIGDAEPLVERLFPEVPMPPLPMWLAAPQALRTNPRIRRVWDILAENLAQS